MYAITDNVSFSRHYIALHYIRVIYSGLSTRLPNQYYTRCTELKTAKQLGRKLPGKEIRFEAVPK